MESTEKVKIKLSGMTCANCAYKIETKLKGLSGVNSSVVNFANEEATVDFNPQTTNYDNFNKAIRDLGYKSSLAKIDLKIIDPLTEEQFENFIKDVNSIEGVYELLSDENIFQSPPKGDPPPDRIVGGTLCTAVFEISSEDIFLKIYPPIATGKILQFSLNDLR